MISINRHARIWVCSKPVNMRKSFEGLSAVARNGMGCDPICGDLFLFIAANRKQARVLFWDGQGFIIIAKRLESGFFNAPTNVSMRGARLAFNTRFTARWTPVAKKRL
jgi:transposase